MEFPYDYFDTAREHEAIFRNILRDLKENRDHRPMGIYVPEDLLTETSLDEIFKKYSTGARYGIFTITNFRVDSVKGIAIIDFEDVAFLSGGGAGLEYQVKENSSVEYVKPKYTMRR